MGKDRFDFVRSYLTHLIVPFTCLAAFVYTTMQLAIRNVSERTIYDPFVATVTLAQHFRLTEEFLRKVIGIFFLRN